MKVATARLGRNTVVAMQQDGVLRPIRGVPNMTALIRQLTEGSSLPDLEEPIPLSEARLLPPVWPPVRGAVAVGLNYPRHVAEGGRPQLAPDSPPALFTKASTSITGPRDDVPLHANLTSQLDYEIELAVIISRRVRDLSASEAWSAVFGLTIANDISARDLQQNHGGQWFRGKGLDGTCPMGPWIVTLDEVKDVGSLELICRVNGEERQSDRAGAMIRTIPELLSVISQGHTLLPGDIVLTGTPGGVGLHRAPPTFLGEGDVVESIVPGLGELRNRITETASSFDHGPVGQTGGLLK